MFKTYRASTRRHGPRTKLEALNNFLAGLTHKAGVSFMSQLHPTGGWRKLSMKRLDAGMRMASMLDHGKTGAQKRKHPPRYVTAGNAIHAHTRRPNPTTDIVPILREIRPDRSKYTGSYLRRLRKERGLGNRRITE